MDAMGLSCPLVSWWVQLMGSTDRRWKGRWTVEPSCGLQVELKWIELLFLPPQSHSVALSPTVLSGFLLWHLWTPGGDGSSCSQP